MWAHWYQLLLLALSNGDQSWYGNTHHGLEFVNVLDFGARGDGVTDDTRAIQRAINHNRLESGLGPAPTARPFAPPRRAVVYLPPGVYALSDTLTLWFFTHLRGSTVEPPTLLLKKSSNGFGNATALKPLLATAGGTNQSIPWWRDNFHANDMFYNQIHSLNIWIESNNPGAVGIYWSIAQQTSLRDITIEGANVGIDVAVTQGYLTPLNSTAGLGGGGTIEDITVHGGQYGMRVAGSQYTMRGLKFNGQAASAIHIAAEVWTFAFATVEASNMPSLLTVGDGVGSTDTSTNNVLLLDVALANITGDTAIALPPDGLPLFIENLTLTGTRASNATVVAAGSATWLDTTATTNTSTNTEHVRRWAGWPGEDRASTRSNGIFVSGELQAAARLALPGARQSALPSRPRPWFDFHESFESLVSGGGGSKMCNAVTDCGATGDNATDDTLVLQACVYRCTGVFLPSGVYLMSDTLILNKNSIIVGEALSQLYLGQSSHGFNDPSAPKTFVDTPNDATGAVQMTDVSIQAGWGNAGAVLLRWRVGRASGLWDVHVNISHNVHIGMHVTGSGAGVLSNMWGWGADHSQWTGEHMSEDAADVGFLGESAGPLWGFGVSFEHHRQAMFSLQGASNYIFLALQTEQAWWLPAAQGNRTTHLGLGSGTSNSTIYGELHCNWNVRGQEGTEVEEMAKVTDAGGGVSIFGLREVGAKFAINQPGIENLSGKMGSWFGVLADVDI